MSSARWLARQRSDQWVLKAAREGYRSRAAYKLLQLDQKHKPPLLTPGGVALELGASPGSWTQVMVKRDMFVVGVDLLPCEPIEGSTFVQGDFTEESIQRQLLDALGGRQADIVVSDLSPNRSGLKSLDEARMCDFAEQGVELARQCLKPGGHLICKLLQGEGLDGLLGRMKPCFQRGALAKPPASRPSSREIYFIGREFKPVGFDQYWLNGGIM